MKKICTPCNLKLLSYLFVILYCIKISLPISNPKTLIVRLISATILYALFFIIDLDIFKRYIYKNTISSIVATTAFTLIAFFIDIEGFPWSVYIGSALIIVQYALFVIKRQFSVRLFLERCGQYFLFSFVMIIWWRFIILGTNLIIVAGELVFDGVEIMVLSVVGFAYFWTVDTFSIKQKTSINS